MKELQHEIIKLIKKHKPSREELAHVLREAKRDKRVKEILGPVKKRKPVRLPYVPSDAEIRKLLQVMEQDGRLDYRLMVKMLLYTGMRSFELSHLKWREIDWEANRIKVLGKGDKERYVPLANVFRDELLLYRSQNPRSRYVFESRRGDKYTERFMRKVFQDYRRKAGIESLSPHKLRHYFITYLTKQGWLDRDIQMLSGHSDRKSLEIYQHMTIDDVEGKFQSVAGGMV